MDYTKIDIDDMVDYFATAHDIQKYKYYIDPGKRKIILETETITKKIYEFCKNHDYDSYAISCRMEEMSIDEYRQKWSGHINDDALGAIKDARCCKSLKNEAEKTIDAINRFVQRIIDLRNEWFANIYYGWMEDNLMRTLSMHLDDDIGKYAQQTIRIVEKFFEFFKKMDS